MLINMARMVMHTSGIVGVPPNPFYESYNVPGTVTEIRIDLTEESLHDR